MGPPSRADDRRLPARRPGGQGVRPRAGVARLPGVPTLVAVVRRALGALEAVLPTPRPATPERWWRLGFHLSPVDFVPRALCSWEHRFDDVRREYRTLYAAEHRVTCLREVLADLRPNARVRADFAEFQSRQGIAVEDLLQPSREVTVEWRRRHVLAPARLARDGRPLVDLDDPVVREELEREHATLLARYGMDHLDISAVRSQARAITQTISRVLHDRGAAGVLFRSNLDDRRCLAIMEGRARLELDGEPVSLLAELPVLVQVCSEYGLVLRRPLVR